MCSNNAAQSQVSLRLFRPGINIHRELTDHDWAAQRAGVNSPQDALRTRLRSDHPEHIRRWFGLHWNQFFNSFFSSFSTDLTIFNKCIQDKKIQILQTQKTATNTQHFSPTEIKPPDSLQKLLNLMSCWVKRNLRNIMKNCPQHFLKYLGILLNSANFAH